ncbi:MAG: AMP-binding protein, partial [Chloroflexales bacterium]|nr:AMP-binding protein [Chloroflexales bacterium]
RGSDAPFKDGRDIAWDAFRARGEGHDGGYIALESNDPAFILATSGTTAKPKLAVHKHGGYQVHIHSMTSWMFGLRETDVWWSMSDIGWGDITTIEDEGSVEEAGQAFERLRAEIGE